ncbi:kinesin motor protein cin8 [Arachnomyces sp. PD_36]|nr:kinesin motor protein cin8 [Arachnomyces sp. PD_36]
MPPRPSTGRATKRTGMRPPPKPRASALREMTQSPADSLRPASASLVRTQRSPSALSNAGTKRKEREYENDARAGEETNIHVVVRCRGRSDREVKENSGVVVSTEGAKGKSLELSMGPNAVSNKTYHFDKVFSPAADQGVVFEDVVVPILNEMLAGYNCTIFAYGQTGTGKTYTMSGDMTDTLGILSDAAGIIPRVLYSLFHRLEDNESSVKCSFIELYNEELRDLLSAEENAKLKIYEDTSKKGHNVTMVQGMEESHIHSASAGINLLREGSHRRQVAATKCNDLSSRSHTVFTITTYVKRKNDAGEDYISTGKLNLVDLAGSENIQRSGAENKRAAEAGLINKSLLTLGRVINALVDKSSHIPYRESKLTRLLQDSLGGRTKTCIIATLSSARSNLEETISTLDYAFRAKNIRNKPQTNSMVSKKTLLREFTTEIEKLKSELIATRHRNGVYLSEETYEEMTVESESRRILSEEQRAKIETMEVNLRNKVQELLSITGNFNSLKKDNEGLHTSLDETQDILGKTEIVLKNTQQHLEEEELLRKAHQDTEEQLHAIGTGLLSTLEKSVDDAEGLHSKLRRRSHLHAINREMWESSTSDVKDVTSMVDERVEAIQSEHSTLLANLSKRMEIFAAEELERVESGKSLLNDSQLSFEKLHTEAQENTLVAREEMNEVLEEIKVLREDVKERVGDGLNGISTAAARISGEVISELGEFHTKLHESYSSLGQDFKTLFESMFNHIKSQKAEANDLRRQLQEANKRAAEANARASSQLETALAEERREADADRTNLFAQIKSLMEETSERQANRLKHKVDNVRGDMEATRDSLQKADTKYGEDMDEWTQRGDNLLDEVSKSKESLKTKMRNDWMEIDEQHTSIQDTTKAVHEETVRIVEDQVKDMGEQMQALDGFVTRARTQNGRDHDSHLDSLHNLTNNASQSYTNIRDRFSLLSDQIRQFQAEASDMSDDIRESVLPLTEDVRRPLEELRNCIEQAPMKEYTPTGQTPEKTHYDYPMTLPQTQKHETLLARMKGSDSGSTDSVEAVEPQIDSPVASPTSSPTKTMVYNDAENEVGSPRPSTTEVLKPTSSNVGLREVDLNIVAARPPVSNSSSELSPVSLSASASIVDTESEVDATNGMAPPPAKKHLSVSTAATATGFGETTA